MLGQPVCWEHHSKGQKLRSLEIPQGEGSEMQVSTQDCGAGSLTVGTLVRPVRGSTREQPEIIMYIIQNKVGRINEDLTHFMKCGDKFSKCHTNRN